MADEDPLAGKRDQVAGKAKEIGGKVAGDSQLEAEGKGQRTAGKIQEKLHEAEENVKGLIDKVRHRKDS
jgi:uncharacterized protein YjbJ (UPF0337 family)